jgi:HPr kinase/phosphorylase
MTKAETLHATAISMSGGGVLFIGPSGSGKSSLAAQMIEHYDAQLIADDRVCLSVEEAKLWAAAPPALAGKIELRGLGIVAMAFKEKAPLSLCVQLAARAQVPRLAEEAYFRHHGISLPQIYLHGHDAATPLTIRHALAHIGQSGFRANGVYGVNGVNSDDAG